MLCTGKQIHYRPSNELIQLQHLIHTDQSFCSMYGDECVTSQYTTAWRVDLEKILSIHCILVKFANIKKVWNIKSILQLYFHRVTLADEKTIER